MSWVIQSKVVRDEFGVHHIPVSLGKLVVSICQLLGEISNGWNFSDIGEGEVDCMLCLSIEANGHYISPSE